MGEGGKDSGGGEEGTVSSATRMEGEGMGGEGGVKGEGGERKRGKRGGGEMCASWLMRSMSAMESSDRAPKVPAVHKVPS